MNNQPQKGFGNLAKYALLLSLIIIGFALYLVLRSNKNVSIEVIANNPTIKIGGQEVKNNSSFYLKPGQYDLKITADGFMGKLDTIKISQDKENNNFKYCLIAVSDEANEWFNNNEDMVYKCEGVIGSDFNKLVDQATTRQPILEFLPYSTAGYSIDYGPSKTNPSDLSAITIYITPYGAKAKQDALNWIKSKGSDPNKLDIVYNKPLYNSDFE